MQRIFHGNKKGPNLSDFQKKKFLDDCHFSYITKLEIFKKKIPGLDVANLSISKNWKKSSKITNLETFKKFLQQ
jgi:hypothetical protein